MNEMHESAEKEEDYHGSTAHKKGDPKVAFCKCPSRRINDPCGA